MRPAWVGQKDAYGMPIVVSIGPLSDSATTKTFVVWIAEMRQGEVLMAIVESHVVVWPTINVGEEVLDFY